MSAVADTPAATRAVLQRRVRRTFVTCVAIVGAMVGLAYASVPLYNLFCNLTGFDGRPMFTATEARTLGERTFTVRFDSNVAPGLPWKFSAETLQVRLKPGETQTINYRVQNVSDREIVGRASYNVEPKIAAQYFNKLQCFCETDTPLRPGEVRDASVVFFLDPDLEKDPDLRNIQSVTLSYTFFASRNAKTVADASSAVKSQNSGRSAPDRD